LGYGGIEHTKLLGKDSRTHTHCTSLVCIVHVQLHVHVLCTEHTEYVLERTVAIVGRLAMEGVCDTEGLLAHGDVGRILGQLRCHSDEMGFVLGDLRVTVAKVWSCPDTLSPLT